MNRRTFTLGAVATGLVAAVTPAFAQTVNAAAAVKSAFPNFVQLMRHLSHYAEVICLAQDSHKDLASNAPLADKGVLSALRDRGYTDIYLEISQEFDVQVKRLLRGESGRVAFIGYMLQARNEFMENLSPDIRARMDDLNDIKSYEGLADTIIAAGEVKGLNIHCVDPLSFRQGMDLGIRIATASSPAEFIALVEERLSYDGKIGETIANSKRGKAVVQFGVWHFMFKSWEPFLPIFGKPEHNIDDHLRARGIPTVSVHLTNLGGTVYRTMVQGMTESPNFFKKLVGIDRPDYEYASRGDKVTALTNALPPVPAPNLPLQLSPK